MSRWTIGVDFGGTTIKCGLVNDQGRVIRSQVLPSPQYGPPEPFLNGMSQTIIRLLSSAGLSMSRLRGLGIGAPGLVETQRGLVHTLVNVPGWRDVPLAAELQRRLQLPVFVDNDVNVMALGEQRFGAGQGVWHFICLTLGTGVGGGLILDGQLYRGARGAAGELGHMMVNPRGRRCACGANGCLEAQIGTAAILSAARRAVRAGAQPLGRLAHQAHGQLTPALVVQAARGGDIAARHLWSEVGRWLGLGLASLINLLNPERIIIGGGVANAWPFFAPMMRKTIRSQALDVSEHTVRVVRAQLADRAGILGAAVLVWNELKR